METCKLAEALAKFQSELKPILKESNNPFFKSKYSDLASVCSSILPSLGKHGLSVTQSGMFHGEKFCINTVLRHTSGEVIESLWPVLAKDQTAQGLGSGSTYARRYALMAIVGASSTDDDDGAIASGTVSDSKPSVYSHPENKKETLSQSINKLSSSVNVPDPSAPIYTDHTHDSSIHGSLPMPFGKTKGTPLNQHNRENIESAMRWAIEKNKFKEFVVEAQQYLQYLDIKKSDLVPGFDERDELPF